MKHWVFDFDGTLVDSEGIFSRSFSYALSPFGVEMDAGFLERIRHKHPSRIFEDFLPENEATIALQRLNEAGQRYVEDVRPYPCIFEVLDTLAANQCHISIWTGRDLESTHFILNKRNMLKYFSKIISGTCVEMNKPEKHGLLEIQKHYNTPFEEMIMVGDHHHDIEPANSLGITSVHAQWKRIPHELPKGIVPRHSFSDTQRFHDWVKEKLKI